MISGEEFGPIKRVWDPLQGVNRVMFTLNDGLYRVILTPGFARLQSFSP